MQSSNQAYYYSAANDPGRKKRKILVIALIVLILGSLVYLIFGDRQKPSGQPDKDQANATGTFDASTLSDFEFVAPDMKGYVKRSDFTVNVGDYTTANNSCNLQFGVVEGSELPGITLEEIASAHLGATEQAGAVGVAPKKGKDLVLQTSNGSAGYSFPTLDYSYSRDGVNYKASYSIIILTGNRRAFVRRYCATSEGQPSGQDFNKVNNKAREIKIRLK
ncbi:MAG TPA: hypothetical protein VFM05_02705 [Candidatus Saccharimonadales bacterium]|nr:hypothetical protein [Candidatus Saccharimonadales bacterium]